MGFKSSISKNVESAFATLGDIAETITYNAKTSSSYNVSTGAVSNTTTTHSLKAVVTYLGEKIDGLDNSSSFTGDLSIIFASNDLSVTPDTNDTITRNSEVYSINNIVSDPVVASYTLNLTRLG